MYVYDPRTANKRSTRAVFHSECAQKKSKILEITDFFNYLVDNEYLTMEYKGLHGRAPLPTAYDKVWRKYSGFYNDVMLGLSFVCLADFTPTQKLYDFWKVNTAKNLALA
jgi:hypothetical protein